MRVLHLNKIVHELVGTVECPFFDRWIAGSLDRLAVAWMPWPKVVLIKSWLDILTSISQTLEGEVGLPRMRETRSASPKSVSPQGVWPHGVWPQGVSPQGGSPQGGLPQGVSPQGLSPQGVSSQGVSSQGVSPQGVEEEKDRKIILRAATRPRVCVTAERP